MSPCAAPAQCAKHFIFEASKVSHLIDTPIPSMSLFSPCGNPVVLKHLMQMTLKAFPMQSDLTQLLYLHVDAAPIAKIPIGNEEGSSSHPEGFNNPTTAVSFKLFFPHCSSSP